MKIDPSQYLYSKSSDSSAYHATELLSGDYYVCRLVDGEWDNWGRFTKEELKCAFVNEKPEPPFDIEGDLYLKDSSNVAKHRAVELNDGSYLIECCSDNEKRWVTTCLRVTLETVKESFTNKKPK